MIDLNLFFDESGKNNEHIKTMGGFMIPKKIYNSADILIKSSILESFYYPPLEMMATGGISVVAPNDGNIEYLRDNENCLLYEQGNIEDAVNKIELIRNDKKLRDKLIKGGIETAKSREWKKIEKEIISLYEE